MDTLSTHQTPISSSSSNMPSSKPPKPSTPPPPPPPPQPPIDPNQASALRITAHLLAKSKTRLLLSTLPQELFDKIHTLVFSPSPSSNNIIHVFPAHLHNPTNQDHGKCEPRLPLHLMRISRATRMEFREEFFSSTRDSVRWIRCYEMFDQPRRLKAFHDDEDGGRDDYDWVDRQRDLKRKIRKGFPLVECVFELEPIEERAVEIKGPVVVRHGISLRAAWEIARVKENA
ncbi:uncharacterized protein RCC_01316 [Ramularia collo-cygni]|uniref:Uncharacterized protein n=1 Tax=Ramularia collo-cygni TaxID=112498 RepID=A0A2D3UML8_9PEZI|nr:uncharacterized protein RCC_01316 [Ramularia collo-cygni]CZT15461.1 uncharacterized protein RCC_01316 [Ramularia collo-cygni]